MAPAQASGAGICNHVSAAGRDSPLETLSAAHGLLLSRRPHCCACQERSDLLANAPHLARPLPILMPCYKWWEVPFYWAGLKMYDLVAGETRAGWWRTQRGFAALRYSLPLGKRLGLCRECASAAGRVPGGVEASAQRPPDVVEPGPLKDGAPALGLGCLPFPP
jgi:hypothetical protein